MVFVVNPDGADVELMRGDRLGALAPAATQTRVCSLCSFVDTDAFVSDLAMCETFGTLLPTGLPPCRQCGAGPEDVAVHRCAGCADCKSRARQASTASGLADEGSQEREVNNTHLVAFQPYKE